LIYLLTVVDMWISLFSVYSKTVSSSGYTTVKWYENQYWKGCQKKWKWHN